MTLLLDSLTPFENFLLTDDQTEQPMTILMRLVVQGRLDLGRAQQALRTACSRHPLLNAQVVHRRWRPYWQLTETSSLTAPTCPEIDVDTVLNQPAVDIRNGAGVRLWAISQSENVDRTELWLEVHHCCSDALGILELVQEWIAEYERLASGASDVSAVAASAIEEGTSPQFSEAQLEMVRQRGEKNVGWMSSRQLKRIANFYFKRGVLKLEHQELEQNRRACEFRTLTGIASAVKALPSNSVHRWTVNDLILTGIMLAANRLLHEWPNAPDSQVLRVGIPVQTREFAVVPDCVANCVSMTFLDRPQLTAVDPIERRNLLRSVVHEMRDVKQNRLYLAMLHALRAIYPLHWVPKSLCGASFVLSNIGRIDPQKFHDLQWDGHRIQNFEFLPPIKHNTNLSLGIVGMRDELHLAVLYQQRYLSAEFVDRLLDLFEEELKILLELLATPAGNA